MKANSLFQSEKSLKERMKLLVLQIVLYIFNPRHPTAYAGLGGFLGARVGAHFGGLFGPLGAIVGGAAGYGFSYLASKLTCRTAPNQRSTSTPETKDKKYEL